jgi:hypothetical protein
MKSFLTALACCVCVSLPVRAHEEPGDEFNSLIASPGERRGEAEGLRVSFRRPRRPPGRDLRRSARAVSGAREHTHRESREGDRRRHELRGVQEAVRRASRALERCRRVRRRMKITAGASHLPLSFLAYHFVGTHLPLSSTTVQTCLSGCPTMLVSTVTAPSE